MVKKCSLAAALAIALIALVRAAQAGVTPPSDARVLRDLVGQDSAGGTVMSAPYERTSIWREQLFQASGELSYVVFTQTQRVDPRTGTPYSDRLAAPVISAAVYSLEDGEWTLSSYTPAFTTLKGWSGYPAGKADVLLIPHAGLALLIDTVDVSQDVTDEGKAVFQFFDHDWRDLGVVRTGGNNVGVAPTPRDEYENHGTVSILAVKEGVPDLRVTRRGTMPASDHKLVTARGAVYSFNGKEYVDGAAEKLAANQTRLLP